MVDLRWAALYETQAMETQAMEAIGSIRDNEGDSHDDNGDGDGGGSVLPATALACIQWHSREGARGALAL